jgi:hypothetical protein
MSTFRYLFQPLKPDPLGQDSLLTGSADSGLVWFREIPSGAREDTYYPVLSRESANDYLIESAPVQGFDLRPLASGSGGGAKVTKGFFVTAEIS